MGRLPSVGLFLPRPDRGAHLARKLRERGFEVVHYSLEQPGQSVKVRRGFLSQLAHVLLRTRHDVYFVSLLFTPTLVAHVNRMLRGRPYVLNLTGVTWATFDDRSRGKPWPAVWERSVFPFLLSRVLAGAGWVACNSRFLEREVSTRYPEQGARMSTIYNGIDAEQYGNGRAERIPGVDRGDLVLLCVTTLNHENKSRGLEVVIEAFSRVWKRRRDVKLVVAAKAAHRRYGSELEAYVRSQPWRDSVVLFYNHPSIPDLLASGDVFMFATPSNSNDSLPRVLLEAQTAGLPAVTTDTMGCPEIVADGVTGFVTPYEAGSMAERVERLIDDPDLRSAFRNAARPRIAATFNWDVMAERYACVFCELAG